MALQVLAISSSRVANSGYLEMAAPQIEKFLGNQQRTIAFVPFAAVDNNFTAYLNKVKDGLAHLPYNLVAVTPQNGNEVVQSADAIMVGGGNTFYLLHLLYKYNLLNLIHEKVTGGIPYIGWSAGANIAGLTIKTTNDMPVIEPASFNALGFLPFQINPHYINLVAENHHGETRDERLTEYLLLNKAAKIVALPEGSALQYNGDCLQVIGSVDATLLTLDAEDSLMKTSLPPGDVSFLL